jgi:hypothetical protein
MTEELKSILAANERYADFVLLDTPVPFAEWAKDKYYDEVQVHDTALYKWGDDKVDIIGFAGSFGWKDNILTSLDCDIYDPNMPVIGYKEYEEYEGEVDILVKAGEWQWDLSKQS